MFHDGLAEQTIEAVVLPQRKQSCSLEDDHTKRDTPYQWKGHCIQLDRSN